MIDKNTAAQSIRALATRYESMMAAADILESIASQENALLEVQKAAKEAGDLRDKALAALDVARQDVQDAQAEADEIDKKARFDADLIVGQAKKDAEQLVEDAKSRAEQAGAAAQAQAQDALDLLAQKSALVQSELDRLESLVPDAKARAEAATAEADAAEERLAKVKAAIAELAAA